MNRTTGSNSSTEKSFVPTIGRKDCELKALKIYTSLSSVTSTNYPFLLELWRFSFATLASTSLPQTLIHYQKAKEYLDDIPPSGSDKLQACIPPVLSLCSQPLLVTSSFLLSPHLTPLLSLPFPSLTHQLDSSIIYPLPFFFCSPLQNQCISLPTFTATSPL